MMRRAISTRPATRLAARAFAYSGALATTPLRLAAPKPPKYTDPDMTHFRQTTTAHPLYTKPAGAAATVDGQQQRPANAAEWANPMQNAVWSEEEANGVKRTHLPPVDLVDRAALVCIKALRFGFDVISGYLFGRLTPTKIMRRVLFLETAAGIPGMVGGTVRHLYSLRQMKRDHGWIHTLLEEAENERMHMLTFMKCHKPGTAFKGLVLVAQGLFWNFFFVSYLISPRFCHRFVGYLEEEAVRTYTHILETMKSTDSRDAAVVKFGEEPADEIAIRYWRLKPDATMYDVMLAVRADEANHRDVNHTLACLKRDDRNPFLEHKHGSALGFGQKVLADRRVVVQEGTN